MGKSKSKRPKQAPEAVPVLTANSPATGSQGSVQATDGHNTQGWTNDEIKAYNELLIEREKLEKQRYELEEKCAKSQTQRALLHENVANIDSMFKQQKAVPLAFKFTGASTCCVDLDLAATCHHEICKRAKTRGVSDAELDTIKYYSMRINTEKSDRVRNALRKQRDLELIRIKKEGDEEQAQMARKSSKASTLNHGEPPNLGARSTRGRDMSRAAKETEKIVNKIITQLDDLRSDLQTGRISAQEAQGKLNILDSKLPLIQDKANGSTGKEGVNSSTTSQDISHATDSFQAHLRDRLLNSKGDTFSQAFSIMDHFLSATKPDDLQKAISELKDVLQLTGPMCDELQNSLEALEDIFDSPEKLSFTGPDGKQECNSIIDLMDRLKETLKRTGQLPDGANASLTKVFQECIDLEAEAKEQLTLKCHDGTTTSANLPSALRAVKDTFVAKSPIPPLTSNKLDIDIANLLDVYDAQQLLAQAGSGAKATELEAQITSLVISRTQRNSAKYVHKLRRLELACESAGNRNESGLLMDSITNVLNKIVKWIPAAGIKKEEKASVTERVDGRLRTYSEQDARPNTDTSKAANISSTSIPSPKQVVPLSEQAMKDAQVGIRTSIVQNGIWKTFELYCQKALFTADIPMLDKAKSYKEKVRGLIEDEACGMLGAISYLYKLKLCPGLVAVLVSQVLFDIAAQSDADGRKGMKTLSRCIQTLSPLVSSDWSATFQHIMLAMTKLYVATYVESMAIFPTSSALALAMSTMATVTKFVLLARSASVSEGNLEMIKDFLTISFSGSVLKPIASLEEAFGHFHQFAADNRYKCMTTGTCTKHMNFTRMPFNPHVVAAKPSFGKYEAPEVDSKGVPTVNDVAPLAGPSAAATTIPSPLEPSTSAGIAPMKTTVYHRSRQQAEHPAPRVLRKHDLRLAESLKQAALLYELTARKASAQLQLRGNDSDMQTIIPSTEVISAMDDIFNSTVDDIDRNVGGVAELRSDTLSTTSKFVEHLDVRDSSARSAFKSALSIQNVFKQLRNGALGAEYLNVVKKSIRERAMSGRYSNPIEAVTGFAVSLSKIGKVPGSLADALVQTQNDIQTILENPPQWLACETRRLKHLLAMVDADKPSVRSMFQLALKSPSAFHEYHEIMFDKLEESKTVRLEMLEEAAADITQLAKTLKLKTDSSSLLDFARIAVEDWRQRPASITKYRAGPVEEDNRGYREGDLSNADSPDSGITPDAMPTIAASPAKYPVVEKQSLKASAVPSRASITYSEKVDVPLQSQGAKDTSLMSNGWISQNHDGKARHTIHSPQQDNSIQDDNKGSSKPGQESTRAGLTEQDKYRGSRDSEPQYLLPGMESPISESNASANHIETSTPTSFRMLDMTRHLSALQKNSRDLFQTSKEVDRFNRDHGHLIHSLADKVSSQVTQYAAFVEQIAAWNGVELAMDMSFA